MPTKRCLLAQEHVSGRQVGSGASSSGAGADQSLQDFRDLFQAPDPFVLLVGLLGQILADQVECPGEMEAVLGLVGALGHEPPQQIARLRGRAEGVLVGSDLVREHGKCRVGGGQTGPGLLVGIGVGAGASAALEGPAESFEELQRRLQQRAPQALELRRIAGSGRS